MAVGLTERNQKHKNQRKMSSSKDGDKALGSDLIPVINKLQDIFAVTGGQIGQKAAHASALTLELPQIVVVGSQSSGCAKALLVLLCFLINGFILFLCFFVACVDGAATARARCSSRLLDATFCLAARAL